MSKNIILASVYHRHKLLGLIDVKMFIFLVLVLLLVFASSAFLIKLQSVCRVHKVIMQLPVRCGSAGTLTELQFNKFGAYSERQNPRLSSKRRPHFKIYKRSSKDIKRSWFPTEPEGKNDCAGEGQQQFTELDWTRQHRYFWFLIPRNIAIFFCLTALGAVRRPLSC
jgi:hypothetical protein